MDEYTPTDDEIRFWSRVNKRPDGCWEWIGRRYWDGYGIFYKAGRSVRAHRWSYENFSGPIPEGLVMDHLCRNRACVNPEHLEPVTNRENLLRGDGPASRTHCPRGHGYSFKGDGTRYCRTCNKEREAERRSSGSDRKRCPHCGDSLTQLARHIERKHAMEAV